MRVRQFEEDVTPGALQEPKESRKGKYILITLGVMFLIIFVGTLEFGSPKGANSSGVESLRISASCLGCEASTTYGQQFSGHIFNSTGGKSSSYSVEGNGSRSWVVYRQPRSGGWYVSWSFGSYSFDGTLTVTVQLSDGRVVYHNSAVGFATSLFGNYRENQTNSTTG